MARRKKQDAAIGVLIVIGAIVGIPIWLVAKASDAVGPTVVTIVLVLLAAGAIYLKVQRRKQRIAYLLSKYGDPRIVDLIMQGKFWNGQTSPQLVDSIGNPAAIDDHFLKTKKKQVWKYNRDGHNRYKLRLTLENDVVVGWDQRA